MSSTGRRGECASLRYAPEVKFQDQVVAAPPPQEDPLVGPLRVEDFHQLAPGESFDPTQPSHGASYLPLSTFANFVPSKQGRYRFELALSTESASPERWLGRFNQEDEHALCSRADRGSAFVGGVHSLRVGGALGCGRLHGGSWRAFPPRGLRNEDETGAPCDCHQRPVAVRGACIAWVGDRCNPE